MEMVCFIVTHAVKRMTAYMVKTSTYNDTRALSHPYKQCLFHRARKQHIHS